jgi:glutathione peroxidase
MIRKIFISLLSAAIIFFLYVTITNMDTMNMSGRQKVMKAIYPVITSVGRLLGKNADVIENGNNIKPAESIYNITLELNDGTSLSLSSFRGKKLLLVNTASDCGYTAQYDGLQKLHEQRGGDLVIIGFPANDFKEQEKGSDAEIGAFCRKNYGVSFLLAKKGSVVKGNEQQELYRWLTHKNKNGWNAKNPSWNFTKYLVNEEGTLTHYFGPSIEPGSDTIAAALEK